MSNLGHTKTQSGIVPGVEIARLAGSYMTYVLDTAKTTEGDVSQSERAYVLWDWEGLAALAYRQFLKQGRGVFIGPRIVMDEDNSTIAFDYVARAGGSVATAISRELATAVDPYIDHYHPELDFVVVWIRKDG